MDAVCSRLRIGRRFRGPPGAANGGFASGSLAALLGGAVDVEVSLRRSVPLEHPLEVRHDRDAALLLDDHGCLLAEARPPAAEVELTVPDTPTPVAAVEAAAVPAGTPVLLGQMSARLGARPRIGTEYRMVAWLLGRDGGKLTAGSALLGPDGEVLAAARALWVTVTRTAATPRTRWDEQSPGTNVRTTAGGSG
jgi:hypothetical protein